MTGITDEIFEIEAECFDRAWSFETLSFELHSPLSVLSVEHDANGVTVSYALGRVVAGEGELLRIGTRAGSRRRGLARRVLEDIILKMREMDAEVCFLEVRSKNAPAVSLYESCGFERVGLRKKYYDDDDAIVMSKKIR